MPAGEPIDLGHDSTRTCAGCGEHAERVALLRLVLAGDPQAVVPDVRHRAPGRGVSVHPRYACLDSAVKRGRLAAGLRTRAGMKASELAHWARAQYARRAEGLIGAAVRAGHAAVGIDRARDAVRSREAHLLVWGESPEASPRLGHGADERLDDAHVAHEPVHEPACVHFADPTRLGALCGRGPEARVNVVAILSRSIAREIEHAIRAHADLVEGS